MNALREIPVCWKEDEVRAYLAGTKTEHRVLAVNTNFAQVREGSRLWVQEVFYAPRWCWRRTAVLGAAFLVSGSERWAGLRRSVAKVLEYHADRDLAEDVTKPWLREKWFPDLTMPRWAARISLEVTEVRRERLLDITDEGALAQGFESLEAFRAHWCAWRGGMAWKVNPETIVLRFAPGLVTKGFLTVGREGRKGGLRPMEGATTTL